MCARSPPFPALVCRRRKLVPPPIVVGSQVPSVVYVYDFNAWWRHDIRVERRMVGHHSESLLRCVAGYGACPREDVGGLERFLEVRKRWSEW
ncbi:IS1096 element passenger TnpR family protein [Cupriavidus necator]